MRLFLDEDSPVNLEHGTFQRWLFIEVWVVKKLQLRDHRSIFNAVTSRVS